MLRRKVGPSRPTQDLPGTPPQGEIFSGNRIRSNFHSIHLGGLALQRECPNLSTSPRRRVRAPQSRDLTYPGAASGRPYPGRRSEVRISGKQISLELSQDISGRSGARMSMVWALYATSPAHNRPSKLEFDLPGSGQRTYPGHLSKVRISGK